MNWSDAVKALRDDKTVDSIMFHRINNSPLHIIIGYDQTIGEVLMFKGSRTILRANNPEFILRNDFELVHKKPGPPRMSSNYRSRILCIRFTMHQSSKIPLTPQNQILLSHVLNSLKFNINHWWPIEAHVAQAKTIDCMITTNQFADFILDPHKISEVVQWEILNSYEEAHIFDLT